MDAYYASKNKDNEPATGTTPGTGEKPLTPPATVEEKPKTPEIRKIAYITFSIDSGSNNDAILDILSQYNINATFFIQGKTLFENDDSIRRMIATGHAVGISGYNGDADFRAEPSAMLEEMAKANDLLFKIARVKTRLVRVPSGSKSALDKDDCDALIDAGYRFWDWNTDPKGTHENPSSATIYRNAVKALKARNTPAVIILRDDQSSVSALSRILKYIKDSNYIARVISVLDSPVNQLNDNR